MTDHQVKWGGIPWPPVIYIVAIAASTTLGLLYPLPWIGGLLGYLLFAIGGLAVLAAAALWITSIRSMIRAKTTINPNAPPDHLVTTGPFATTRNPIYLANTLLLIAISLLTGSLWFLLFAFLAAFATRKLAIDREEKALTAKFGKRYRDYAKKVRRWI